MKKYSSVVAECVSAHYMGGDALKAFLLLQQGTAKETTGR